MSGKSCAVGVCSKIVVCLSSVCPSVGLCHTSTVAFG